MTKNKNRLDDSDITNFDKDAPPPKDVSPEELTELRKKLEASLARRFSSARQDRVLRLCRDGSHLDRTPVNEFLDLLVVER